MSINERYAQHIGSRAEPAAAPSIVSTMRGVTFTEEELEEQGRNTRRAHALIEIQKAEREQAAAAERERAEFRSHVRHDTAIGQLFSGGR
jgi:hypothetical protein